MSAENKKVIHGMYEAFGNGDIGTVIAALDPDVEWMEAVLSSKKRLRKKQVHRFPQITQIKKNLELCT